MECFRYPHTRLLLYSVLRSENGKSISLEKEKGKHMSFQPDSSTHPSDRPSLPVTAGEVEEESIYPFTLAETVFITENNDYCEQMVRQWIAHKGNLHSYYNTSMNSTVGLLPAITTESPFFRLVEKTGKIAAEDEYDMIAKLDEAYGEQGHADKERYQKIRDDEELITTAVACPSKAMMHLSLRKKPISSGGHAIGVARFNDTYYIYDPNNGMFKVQGQDRLKEILTHGFAGQQLPRPEGPWSSYIYFYRILVPDALDTII